jgi:hypothetical protein
VYGVCVYVSRVRRCCSYGGMCGMCEYVCTLHIMLSYHKGSMGVCMRVHAHCVQAMGFHKGRHGQYACVYTCLGNKSSCSESWYGCMSCTYMFAQHQPRGWHGVYVRMCVCTTAAAKRVGMGVGMCKRVLWRVCVYVCTCKHCS